MTLAENSTFYFLKVELGIDSCEEVTAIERMKHGTEYLWLWIRLALKYANYGGVLCKRIGKIVIPVTVEDITAEMKGGFSDVSIKDGISTLMKGSLMYINTEGFMAITGLSITGDPKEPTLHKQNSNNPEVRPLSIGKDTRVAKYHRERRRQLKEQEQHLLLEAPKESLMSYADMDYAITKPEDAIVVMQTLIGDMANEYFAAVYLNTKNKPLDFMIANIAGTDYSRMDPATVIKDALLQNAPKVMLFHNHPSGELTPSQVDLVSTQKMVIAAKLNGIEILDHVIVAGNDFHSFAENGEIDFSSSEYIVGLVGMISHYNFSINC